jgi:V/A-type H+-transporting ATPase subunit K
LQLKETKMEGVIGWEKVLIAFAAALAIGFSALATGWAQSRIGAAGAGALAEKPELSATVIIMVAIPETMVILGFVIAAMILLME